MFFVQHPGKILREELGIRNLSQKDFASIIGKSFSELSEIVNAKRNVTAKRAILIGTALNISPEFRLGLQKDYDLHYEKNRLKKGSLEKIKKNLENFSKKECLV